MAKLTLDMGIIEKATRNPFVMNDPGLFVEDTYSSAVFGKVKLKNIFNNAISRWVRSKLYSFDFYYKARNHKTVHLISKTILHIYRLPNNSYWPDGNIDMLIDVAGFSCGSIAEQIRCIKLDNSGLCILQYFVPPSINSLFEDVVNASIRCVKTVKFEKRLKFNDNYKKTLNLLDAMNEVRAKLRDIDGIWLDAIMEYDENPWAQFHQYVYEKWNDLVKSDTVVESGFSGWKSKLDQQIEDIMTNVIYRTKHTLAYANNPKHSISRKAIGNPDLYIVYQAFLLLQKHGSWANLTKRDALMQLSGKLKALVVGDHLYVVKYKPEKYLSRRNKEKLKLTPIKPWNRHYIELVGRWKNRFTLITENIETVEGWIREYKQDGKDLMLLEIDHYQMKTLFEWMRLGPGIAKREDLLGFESSEVKSSVEP